MYCLQLTHSRSILKQRTRQQRREIHRRAAQMVQRPRHVDRHVIVARRHQRLEQVAHHTRLKRVWGSDADTRETYEVGEKILLSEYILGNTRPILKFGRGQE